MNCEEPEAGSSSLKRKRNDRGEDSDSEDDADICHGGDDESLEWDGPEDDNFELGKVMRYQKVSASSNDIKITPFNLKEELEEGTFDEEGNFIFKDSSDDEDKDAWADSVDWEKVEKERLTKEEREKALGLEKFNKESNDARKKQDSPASGPIDKLSSYKEMLRIMKPHETVQKSIKRLGDCVPRRKLVKSKMGMSDSAQYSPSEIAEFKAKLDRMIELAHLRLEDGDSDIYQRTYDDLEGELN